MRIGLIGYGTWGKAHANTIKNIAGAELVAIAVPSIDSRHAAEADHQVPVYEDYRKMIDRSDLDVIDVVSPNAFHREMALASIESDRDLILEKPMAATAVECDEILSAAQAKGKLITICHESRNSPLWGGVRKLIAEGRIGDPLYVMVELWRRPFRAGSSGWKQDPSRVVSWFHEEPIHFFDLVRWYLSELGEPTRVFARGSSKAGPESPLIENMSAMVDFPGGAYAVVTESLCGWGHSQTVKVAGAKGAIVASWSGAGARETTPEAKLVYFDGSEAHQMPLGKGLSQMEELRELIHDALEAFRARKEAPVTGADGRASVALCEAAQKSIRTGEPVELGLQG